MQIHPLRKLVFAGIATAGLFFALPAPAAAQISFGVNIGGPAPECPYGYYGYAPYNCAPYGYYGPEWFNGGVFLGAGPWYRGPAGGYGWVNHDYDPRYGYRGPFPDHGHFREPDDHWRNFHGNDFHGPYGEGHHEGFHGGQGRFGGDHGGDHGGHH
jgi:hypothetical protein